MDWKEEIKLLLFEDHIIIYPPQIQLLKLGKEFTNIFRYKTCEILVSLYNDNTNLNIIKILFQIVVRTLEYIGMNH